MFKNKKGQILFKLIPLILGTIIFIFAAPIVATIIDENVGTFGTATAFVVKLFLWLVLLVLLAVGYNLISSGEGFFA